MSRTTVVYKKYKLKGKIKIVSELHVAKKTPTNVFRLVAPLVLGVPEVERDGNDQVLAGREHVLGADEFAHGSSAGEDELAGYVPVAARLEDDEAEVEVAVLAPVLAGFVEEADVDLAGLEHDHVVGLHFARAFRIEVATQATLVQIQARLAHVNDAKVLSEVVERHPEDALVATPTAVVVRVERGRFGELFPVLYLLFFEAKCSA